MLRPLALALALSAPVAVYAQTGFTLNATPTLCSDLTVAIAQTERRGHLHVTLRVSNAGPGAYQAVRGQQSLAVASTASNGTQQDLRYAFGTLNPGQSAEFSFDRPLAEGPFATWAMIQFASATPGDCNGGNNTALATHG